MNPNQPQYPPPGAPMPGQPGVAPAKSGPAFNPTLTDAVIGVSGLLVFLLSFAPLYSYSAGGFGSGSVNSWQAPYAPVSTWVALAALVTVALVALSLWWPRDKHYVGFSRGHLMVGLTIYMAVQMLGFLFATPDSVDLGFGGWIMLLFSLAAAVFAVLGHLGKMQGSVTSMMKSSTPAAYPGAYQPPATGGYQPPPAGYTQPTQPAQPGYQPGAYPPAPGQPGQYPPPGQG